MVVNELRGEKIDIVPYTDDIQEFVMKALSPAKVKEVRLDDDTGTAEVIVPDYQLSLAIGKEGQNARLAARLTGWRVDIKSESQLADEEAGYEGEEWAEGEWVTDAESGELTWRPAEGGPAVTAEEWRQGGDVVVDAATGGPPTGDDVAAPAAEAITVVDTASIPEPPEAPIPEAAAGNDAEPASVTTSADEREGAS
jgi:N utilization substance protein A